MIGREQVTVRFRGNETTVSLLPDFRCAVAGAKEINVVPDCAEGEQYKAWWSPAFLPPHADDRDDLRLAHRLPVARVAAAVRTLADGLQPVAFVVQVEVCRCLPSEGASGRLWWNGRKAIPVDRTHQGRGQHQAARRCGWKGPFGEGRFDGGISQRREDRSGPRGRIGGIPGGGQGMRQPRHAEGGGAVGKPQLHSDQKRQHKEEQLPQKLVPPQA